MYNLSLEAVSEMRHKAGMSEIVMYGDANI